MSEKFPARFKRILLHGNMDFIGTKSSDVKASGPSGNLWPVKIIRGPGVIPTTVYCQRKEMNSAQCWYIQVLSVPLYCWGRGRGCENDGLRQKGSLVLLLMLPFRTPESVQSLPTRTVFRSEPTGAEGATSHTRVGPSPTHSSTIRSVCVWERKI